MATRDVSINIKAKDNASGVFDTINQNAKRSFGSTTGGGSTRVGTSVGGFSVTGTLAGVAGAATGVGIAIGAASTAFSAMITPAMNFETQMSSVKAVLQPTNLELEKLSDLSKELGRETAFTAQESAEAIEELGKVGLNTEEVMAALSPTLNLASAATIGLSKSAVIVTDVMNNMGLEADDVTNIVDVMAKTATSSGTNISELGSAFTYAGSQAKIVGLNLTETAAALGIVADAGLRGTKGGTNFAAALRKMTKPSREARILLDQLGLSFTDNSGKIRDFGDILNDLQTANLTPEQLQTLFGAQGIRAMTPLIEKGKEGFEQFAQSLEFSGGAAERMADEKLDNLGGSLTKLASAWDGLMISMGEGQTGIVKTVVDDLTGALNHLTTAGEELQTKWSEFEELDASIQKWLKEQGDAVDAFFSLNSVKELFNFVATATGAEEYRFKIVPEIESNIIELTEEQRTELQNTIKTGTTGLGDAISENIKSEFDAFIDGTGEIKIRDSALKIAPKIISTIEEHPDPFLTKVFSDEIDDYINEGETGIRGDIKKLNVPIVSEMETIGTEAGEKLEEKLSEKLVENLTLTLQNSLQTNLSNIFSGDTEISTAFSNIGSDLSDQFAQSFTDPLSEKISAKITENATKFTSMFKTKGEGFGLSLTSGIGKIFGGQSSAVGSLLGTLGTVMPYAGIAVLGLNMAKSFVDPLKDAFKGVAKIAGTVFGGIGSAAKSVFGAIRKLNPFSWGKGATIESAWDPRILAELFKEGYQVGDKVDKEKAREIARRVGAGTGLKDGFSFRDLKGREEDIDRKRTQEEALRASVEEAKKHGIFLGEDFIENALNAIDPTRLIDAELDAIDEKVNAEIDAIGGTTQHEIEAIDEVKDAGIEVIKINSQSMDDFFADQTTKANELYALQVKNEYDLNGMYPTDGLRKTNEIAYHTLRMQNEKTLHDTQMANANNIKLVVDQIVSKVNELQTIASGANQSGVETALSDWMVEELQRRSFQGDQTIYPQGIVGNEGEGG